MQSLQDKYMETYKKDLSWWDYNKHKIIKMMMLYGFIVDDVENVEWKIWHVEETAKEFFSNLERVEAGKSTLTSKGNGYFMMSAVDAGEKIDIIFKYKDYNLISVSYTNNHLIYKEYIRSIK